MKIIKAIFFLSAVFYLLFSLLLANNAFAIKQDNQATNAALLEPQALLKFNDVPVPVGFKFLAPESYSFETSGVRIGLLKYQGKGQADRVVNFYKEQMAMYGWTLLNVIEYGERMMNFDRENESCIINLIPKGSNVFITIALGPKSQVLPKKIDKPVK